MHYIRLCLEVIALLNGNDLTDVLKNNRDMLMLIRNGSMRHGNKFTEEFYERVRDFEKILKGEICCD